MLDPILNIVHATPRHHKTPAKSPAPPSRPPVRNSPPKWPRIGKTVSDEDLVAATKLIFGYAPREWQLRAAKKLLECNDIFVVAGTGSGKSLVFALVAIAAQLARFPGLIIVICPLKALQLDQVRRLNDPHGNQADTATSADGVPVAGPPILSVPAVAINEDNSGKAVFDRLERGEFRICYAAPEALLRNDRFKRLFQAERFRSRIVANIVDEAHVISSWGKDFRQDYTNLNILKVISGKDVPWAAFSATVPTHVFEEVYGLLGLGVQRPFWGLDLGSDRPNLALWVRPMEFPATSFAALFAFLPESPKEASDLTKTIIYLKTRRQTRTACDIIRAVLPLRLRPCIQTFHAVHSEKYKTVTMDRFRSGEIRWLLCTDAAGMGCDIPDIMISIIFGMQALCDAFQKGGRAVRNLELRGTMVWIVEDWVFSAASKGKENEREDSQGVSKAAKALADRQAALDQASVQFIEYSQSDHCMRQFMVDYFHPRPNLPGFPLYNGDEGEDGFMRPQVTWEVEERNTSPHSGCCCSAKSCRSTPSEPIGTLTDSDRERIQAYLTILRQASSVSSITSAPSRLSPPGTPRRSVRLSVAMPSSPKKIRVVEAERNVLFDALMEWRDTRWAEVKDRHPFLSKTFVMDDADVNRLVNSAHRFINSSEITEELVNSLINWSTIEGSRPLLLLCVKEFRQAFFERADKASKRPRYDASSQQEPQTPTRSRFTSRRGDATLLVDGDTLMDENDASRSENPIPFALSAPAGSSQLNLNKSGQDIGRFAPEDVFEGEVSGYARWWATQSSLAG